MTLSWFSYLLIEILSTATEYDLGCEDGLLSMLLVLGIISFAFLLVQFCGIYISMFSYFYKGLQNNLAQTLVGM